jgi:hypothetical protein
MKKFLLALQYWDGDKAEAEQLARLIADLESTRNPEVDIMLVCRFDSGHSGSLVEHVSKKFDVYTHKSRRRETGWPAGCNALFFDTVTRIYELCHARKLPQYQAILTFEADCCPLRPGWLEMLWADWQRAKVKFMGDILKHPGEHMNGNMFLSGDQDLLKKIAHKIIGCAPSGGWDFLLAPHFKQAGWYSTPLMRSEWTRQAEFTAKELEDQIQSGLVFHHGLKNDSLKRVVRQRWLPQVPPIKKS